MLVVVSISTRKRAQKTMIFYHNNAILIHNIYFSIIIYIIHPIYTWLIMGKQYLPQEYLATIKL